MAGLEMKCPHCGLATEVNDEWIGLEVECPGCQKTFTVAKEAPAEPERSVPHLTVENTSAAAGTFSFVCPSCGSAVELPQVLLGKEFECKFCFEKHIAEATTERQCPFCGQTVKYHASVCKFCKADLTRTPPESAPAQEETFIFICPECDTMTELPKSKEGLEYECNACGETSIAVPAEERKCPFCGEKIKIQAVLCKHCRKKVPPLRSPQTLRPAVSGGRRPGMPSSDALSPSADKFWGPLLLWNLLWPGAGHIYLGQKGKGILFAVLILPIAVCIGSLPLSPFICRLLFSALHAWILGDSFNMLMQMELGDPVGLWNFSSPAQTKELTQRLSPEMQKTCRKNGIIAIVCLLLGITGPGILGLIFYGVTNLY